MATAAEIEAKVSDYLEGDYEVQETDTIPSVENVTFGKAAKRLKICVLYIDLRNSTDLLLVHQKKTAGKIHKGFLHAAASVVNNNDGYIRGFKGDSLMALWPSGYKNQITTCVRSAMQIKWLLDVKLSKHFEAYQKIDFGIGVDWGEVYVMRAGIPRDANNNDLIFMGECINYAVGIGEQAKGPYHVEISPSTNGNLLDELVQGTSEGQQVQIWKDGKIQWKGAERPTKITTWHCPF